MVAACLERGNLALACPAPPTGTGVGEGAGGGRRTGAEGTENGAIERGADDDDDAIGRSKITVATAAMDALGLAAPTGAGAAEFCRSDGSKSRISSADAGRFASSLS